MKKIAIFAVALIAIMMIAGAYLVTSDKQVNLTCSGCDNKCTADSNCGSATCGAVNGGTCTCASQGCGSCNGSCGGSCGSSQCSATTSPTKTCGCSK